MLHTGATNDPVRRVYEHKNKLVKGFTSHYHTTMLVYYEETQDVVSAIRRGKEIKGWLRIKTIDWMESVNPDRRD